MQISENLQTPLIYNVQSVPEKKYLEIEENT